MKFRCLFILIIGVLNQSDIIAQVRIQFQPTWMGEEWKPGIKNAHFNSKDTIILETLRFYISDIVPNQESIAFSHTQKKHYLMDAEQPDGLSIILENVNSNSLDFLEFTFGIDSITQIKGPMGNDLDPIHGMYWTWQTGFIHLKMEGTFSGCSSRKKKFQYHIGGFENPWNTILKKKFSIPKSNLIKIEIPLEKIIPLNNNFSCEIMRPGKEALEMAKRFVESLMIKI